MHMFTFALLTAIAAPAVAQPVAIDVHLSNFKFEPSTIELKAGQDYALTLINDGSGGHSFSAKEFFAAAGVDAADAALIKTGAIDLKGGDRRTVHFRAPAAGTYSLKCSHAFHSGFGMKGEIVVR